MKIEIEESSWDKPFMRVVIDPNLTEFQVYSAIREWNKFKTKVDDQFELLKKQTSDTPKEKGN